MSSDVTILITGHIYTQNFPNKSFLNLLNNENLEGTEFEQKDLNEVSIGNKNPSYEVWILTNRCYPKENLIEFIKAFKACKFDDDSNVVMTIDCDNNEDLSGVYIHPDCRDYIR